MDVQLLRARIDHRAGVTCQFLSRAGQRGMEAFVPVAIQAGLQHRWAPAIIR